MIDKDILVSDNHHKEYKYYFYYYLDKHQKIYKKKSEIR